MGPNYYPGWHWSVLFNSPYQSLFSRCILSCSHFSTLSFLPILSVGLFFSFRNEQETGIHFLYDYNSCKSVIRMPSNSMQYLNPTKRIKINSQTWQNMKQMETEFVCSMCYKFLSTMYNKRKMKHLRVLPDHMLHKHGCKSIYHKKLTDSFKS